MLGKHSLPSTHPTKVGEISLHVLLLGKIEANAQVGILCGACSLFQRCPCGLCFIPCVGDPVKVPRMSSARTIIGKLCSIQLVILCESSICTFTNTRQRLKTSEEGVSCPQAIRVCTNRELAISAEVVLESKVANSIMWTQCYCPAFCLRQGRCSCKKGSYLSHITL